MTEAGDYDLRWENQAAAGEGMAAATLAAVSGSGIERKISLPSQAQHFVEDVARIRPASHSRRSRRLRPSYRQRRVHGFRRCRH